jgi:hypothetical protein
MPTPLRLVLGCISAAVAALLFLGRDQRIVAGWASENVRSFSTSRIPSSGETTDSSLGTKILSNNDNDYKTKDEERPPLHTLIGDFDSNVTADVEFLLDFAIIGHPKTATTSTLRWLSLHDEIKMPRHEIHSLTHGKPAEFVSQMYSLPAGSKYKRGYKAPRDIERTRALDGIAEYFPSCKLVVGLRHPVLWFESFYNFLARGGEDMPVGSLIGNCDAAGNNILCTDEARFHLHLNNLGKTNQTSAEEVKLLKPPLISETPTTKVQPMRNQVFLYEISQLYDEDETRAYTYRRDLGHFIGLKRGLSPIAPAKHNRKNFKYALDICEDQYRPLRKTLMNIAKPASEWIRSYFMQSPDVVVSSPEYFDSLLLDWMEDPCNQPRNGEGRRLSSILDEYSE